MSHRPINEKKLNRLRKQLRKNASNAPVYVDLVEYLISRRYAQTRGQARRIILAKRVKANSHTLGIAQVPQMTPAGTVAMVDTVAPLIPAEYRKDLIVLPEKA